MRVHPTDAPDVLQRLALRAARSRAESGLLLDHERITTLPRLDPPEDDGAEFARKWTQALQVVEGSPLRPVQGLALEVASRQGPPKGILANVAVGAGKTLIFALLPLVWGARRPVLFVPPSAVDDTLEAHRALREYYPIPDITVVSYGKLSVTKAGGLLDDLAPDLIMLDEAQYLSRPYAARTKRFIRYVQENPATRVVAMSGTLSRGSVTDYAHLAEICLREGSPLPTERHVLEKWASVLDPGGEPDEAAWNAVRPLHEWARTGQDLDVTSARVAFATRLSTAPGVVTTVKGSCDTSLVVRGVYPPLSPGLKATMGKVRGTYALPDGTELADATAYARAARQLSMGFYYVWDWPGDPDQEWVDAKNAWASEVRRYLARYSRKGVDTEALVKRYVKSGKGPGSLATALANWEAVADRPEPPTVPVWLDYNPLLWCVAQAENAPSPTLLWYDSLAVGGLLREMGIPTYGSGDGDPDPKDQVSALSIRVYHKQKNYQAWSRNLVLEPPASADVWEQLIGRTHRQGQSEPVVVDIAQHTWAYQKAMRTALERAEAIERKTRQTQKLNTCALRGVG